MAGLAGCGKLDISDMGYDNIVTIGNKVWVKADVEEKVWIYQDKPCVVIKFNDACIARMCTDRDPIPRNLLGAVENAQILDCEGGDGDGDEGSQSESGSLDTGRDRKANTIRDGVVNSENKPKLEVGTTAMDIRSINAMGFQGTAVIPSAAVIPMRSNVRTYGPYASSNFGSSCGGTQVDINTDLAPWVFGSIESMNNAGKSIVESTAIGLTKAETGAITIPGLPISQFSSLGTALGAGGATLSSMNFSYGSGGISTSYEFKTYTPKFGGLNRHLIDKVKDISRNRTEQLRFLRNQQVSSNNINRKIQKFDQKFPAKKNPENEGPNRGKSLQRVLASEIYNWQNDGQRTIVGIDTLNKSVGEMVYDYDKKAYMSLDGLFGPISKDGDGGLPQYASFEAGCHKASPEEPIPPFAIASGSESSNFPNGLDQHNLEITQQYLDPLTNNFGSDEHHHDGPGRGHVIDLVGRGSEVTEDGLITNFYKPDDNNRYSQDYRFLGMRGPILLHSWGYDTQGKPVPNDADIEDDTKRGNFKSEELKDKFLTDWLGKPATWPVAPIDFRFDRKRGVWVSPPGYKVVVAELKEKLDPYETAEAQLINKDTEHNKEFGPKIFNKDGEEVTATEKEDSEAIIKVVDRLGHKYSSGTRIYCYYDTFNCEYIILEAKQKQTIRFRIIDICENTPVEPDYGDDWTKYAGYGDKFPNNHILGIRIDCNGDSIDNKGNYINHTDIANPEKQKDIFVNLYDTCGQFGSAYAYYDANGGANGYNQWKQKAATGFGLLCDPSPENTCSLGESSTQCLMVDNEKYDSYDIVFLDGYARFVECRLKQQLYASPVEASLKYPQDEFKIQNPLGNASATILEVYGDPGNGRDPKFYKNNNGGLEEIEFRVFDPFFGENEEKNPFRHLKDGDKVLCVFNENLKKYIIYNSLINDDSKVVKFSLVQDKGVGDESVYAILVNQKNIPITIDEQNLITTQQQFDNNLIIVEDPYDLGANLKSRFGPALGSDKLQEHIQGINLGGEQGQEGSGDCDNEPIYPFVGFALKRNNINNASGDTRTVYEIITLEHFAKTIMGKVSSIKPEFDFNNQKYYYGFRSYHTDGVKPISRYSSQYGKSKNILLEYNVLNFNGVHSYIVGRVSDEGYCEEAVDGCRFKAILDPAASSTEHLVYNIVEAEHLALTGVTLIKKISLANQLNAGEVFEDTDEEYIESDYFQGFMWDKNKSEELYKKIKILNNPKWTGLPKITTGSRLHTTIVGIQNDGAPIYRIVNADTIALLGVRNLTNISNPGTFGHPNFPEDDRQVDKDPDSYAQGITPEDIDEDAEKPKWKLSPNQQWMTYEGARIFGAWIDRGGPNIKDGEYSIIHAEEAPIIIQCSAVADFKPNKANNISVLPFRASSNGMNSQPLLGGGALLTKVENPMGYGAKQGDKVTIMRVFTAVIDNSANYKYIVIGTGQPPDEEEEDNEDEQE